MALTIIVSNRLPVNIKKVDGKLTFERSTGGVATGLSAYTETNKSVWIGWPGIPNEDLTDKDRQVIIKSLKKLGCAPVFLSKKQVDGFYNGYSNSILWPLFHNLPLKIADSKKYWATYREVNALYSEAIIDATKPNSMIWVHDYQLMLVPKMLRDQLTIPASIGFFLHIPFPTYKTFNRLPEAKPLLKGMLGSDLVGFHTTGYSGNFASTCKHFDSGIVLDKKLVFGNRIIRISEFPIGIDYEKYAGAMKIKQVKSEVARLKRQYSKYKVILTFDRFDITKGFIERVKAYGELLKIRPNLHRKVQLVMLAAPSRTEVEAYQNLKIRVTKLIDEINDEYGTPNWQPIKFLFKVFSFEELTAYYQIADVAFITPLKDGMNLMAKEFIAGQQEHSGVLVLSQTAGAAEELSEAILVNPKRTDSMVNGLERALSMPKKVLKKQLQSMQQTLSVNTAQNWAKTFIDSLENAGATLQTTVGLNKNRVLSLVKDYERAKKRWIFLDYDGTLVDFSGDPLKTPLSERSRTLLNSLSNDPKNTIVIVSSRSPAELDKYTKKLDVGLAAEHGAFVKQDGEWKPTTDINADWKKTLLPLMEAYADKTPGAWVETKKFSLVWHYRNSSPYAARKYLTILKYVLKPELERFGLIAYDGKKVLEVKPESVNKGAAIETWLNRSKGFYMAIGDDFTDEDMFKVLPPSAYTIKVGFGRTAARYRVKTVQDVQALLGKLSG